MVVTVVVAEREPPAADMVATGTTTLKSTARKNLAAGTQRREGSMLDTRLLTWSLGLFSAVTFVVCILYGLVVPAPLHMTAMLEQLLPGFQWLTLGGFAIGLLEAFLYGVYAGLAFGAIYNWLWRRRARSSA